MESRQVTELVSREIDGFRVPEMRDWARSFLITPERQDREWDYGPPVQRIECWLIAKLPCGECAIAFSRCPHAGNWGVVRLNDDSFGPDYCWYEFLEDALIEQSWDGRLPDDYEVR